jgi:hypothetical protein
VADNLENDALCERLRKFVVNVAVEEYQLLQDILRTVEITSTPEMKSIQSNLDYFNKRFKEMLSDVGYRVVDADNFENKDFDPGMSVKPLNMKEFDAEDELVVDKLVEPVVMCGDSIARIGTVMLRRKQI